MSFLRHLYHYRGFIMGSVKREFQSKYQNSLLGIAWAVLQPLAMILVYTLIFSSIMRARLPGVETAYGYSIYLCAGIITWGLFAEIAGRSQTIFLDNAGLIKKLSFPRLCLPIIVVCSAVINFGIIFSLFVVFLLVSGNFPGWAFFSIFPVLAIQVIFAVGLGVSLGVLNVFFRDVGQLFTVVLQFWFWLTPIVYPLSILPERFHGLMALNPMAGLVASYQGILVHGQLPDWSSLVLPAVAGILLCICGLYLFRKHGDDMVDEL